MVRVYERKNRMDKVILISIDGMRPDGLLNCGNEFVYWNAALDRENKCIRDEFYCPHCNTMHNKNNSLKFIPNNII